MLKNNIEEWQPAKISIRTLLAAALYCGVFIEVCSMLVKWRESKVILQSELAIRDSAKVSNSQ